VRRRNAQSAHAVRVRGDAAEHTPEMLILTVRAGSHVSAPVRRYCNGHPTGNRLARRPGTIDDLISVADFARISATPGETGGSDCGRMPLSVAETDEAATLNTQG